MLHLIAAARWRRAQADQSPPPLNTIYIPPAEPFGALEDFINASVTRYALDMHRCQYGGKPGADMRASLRGYKDHAPTVEAIFLGVRRGDPHSGQFTQTSVSNEFA